MAKPMRSVVRKQCSTRFHVQTQPLPVCTWHANPPELMICTALCRNTVRGCSPKLCAHRQTERSPSACESVCFGKAAIVRQQKNKAWQTKNTDSPKKKCRKQSKKKALQTKITKRTRKLQEATDKGLLYKRKQRQTS